MNPFKKKKYAMVGDDNTKDLEKRIGKLEGLVDFLCHHDKDAVVIDRGFVCPSMTGGNVARYCATYLSKRGIKTAEIGFFPYGENAHVTTNNEHMAVVEISNRHFMIDKATGTVVEVTEFCKDKEEGK